MGIISVLLDVILIGFLAIATLDVARYWLIHQAGYGLLFPVLVVGSAILYFTELSLTSLSEMSLPIPDGGILDSILSSTVFCAVVLGMSSSLVANKLIGAKRSVRLAAKWRGDLMERLMQDSVEPRSLVELTLDNGKSYVGFVTNSGIATFSDSDVSIVPLFSGHRSPKKHKLKLTTSYREALIKAADDESNLSVFDFEVALSKSRIVSARRFNMAVYRKDFEGETPS